MASAHEVMAAEPVIRRVVAARAANHADVDDLVQDCLERLLMARKRLAPEAVLPYAVVTARNLVSSHAKTASRRAAATPRVLDAAEPERPDDVLLAGEARDAMAAALARLSDQERRDILAYYSDGSPVGPRRGNRAARCGYGWPARGPSSGWSTCWPSVMSSSRGPVLKWVPRPGSRSGAGWL
jgi:RNA polymerase sigma factor (sigma-70 family)